MNQTIYKRYLCVISIFLYLLSCNVFGNVKDDISDVVIISYVLADNNLELFALRDINEMEAGVAAYRESSKETNNNVRVIAYMDKNASYPKNGVIFDIVADTHDDVKSPIVRSYSEHNSADSKIFSKILLDIIRMYPSKKYVLSVWSHGTGWVHEGYSPTTKQKQDYFVGSDSKNSIISKSFGRDDSSAGAEMNIVDLASALESLPVKFSALIFDACYMGDIEVAYQLRNTSDYIVFSQAEIQSDGFPYQDVIPILLHGVEESTLKDVVAKYYNYFNILQGARQTATISLINTKKLPRLAQSVRAYVETHGIVELVTATQDVQTFSLDSNIAHLHFDMKDLFIKSNTNENIYKKVLSAIEETVINTYNTDKIFNKLDIHSAGGLNMYIPEENHKTDEQLKAHYKTLAWGQDSGIANVWK